MKTILLHVQDNHTLVARLETAMALARRFTAHLTCLHVTPIEAYVALGAFDGAVLLPDLRDALEKGQEAVQAAVQEQLGGEDVSWTYEQVTGHVATTLIRSASLADLLVTGHESQYGASRWASQIGLIGDLLHPCRTPLFMPPSNPGDIVDDSGAVLVAWDGSYEAANAVRAATAFLKAADEVHLLQVERVHDESSFPDLKVMEYLSRHGIQAELRTVTSAYDDIASLIIGEAATIGAGAVVMGGYNHSRTGELLFGGVTRSLLLDCPVPLFMAH